MDRKLWMGRIVGIAPVLVGFLLFSSVAEAAMTPELRKYFVTDGGNGDKTGASWEHALDGNDMAENIQAALDELSQVDGDPGGTVYVATGTYKPTDPGGWLTDGSGRDRTFIMHSGVALVGGWTGEEDEATLDDPAVLATRDCVTAEGPVHGNATILSGDLEGIAGAAPDDETQEIWKYTRIQGNNAYHILYFGSVDDTCLLDGVTIAGGNATDAPGGQEFGGGGALALNSSPVFRHCRFLGCRVENRHGGAVRCYDTASPYNQWTVTFRDCLFQGNRTGTTGNAYCGGAIDAAGVAIFALRCDFVRNRSYTHGGALSLWNISPPLQHRVVGCRFLENYAHHRGGAIRTGDQGSLVLDQCLLIGNHAGNDGGGALHLFPGGGKSIDFTATHCTIAHNTTGNDGGGIDADNSVGIALTVTLTHTVLWGNEDIDGVNESAQISNNAATVAPTFCCILDYGSGEVAYDPAASDNIGFLVDHAPDFLYTPNPGVDGKWTDADATAWTAYDDNIPGDLRLGAVSPCIDAGSHVDLNTDVLDLDGDGDNLEVAPLDLWGNPRVMGLETDMGAYEAPAPLAGRRKYYVRPAATGGGTGEDWDNALGEASLQGVLDELDEADGDPGGTVYVAAGTYRPTDPGGITDGSGRDRTFTMHSGVALVGGWTGEEDEATMDDPAVLAARACAQPPGPGESIAPIHPDATILSGDLEGFAGAAPDDETQEIWKYTRIAGSNAYHVLLFDGVDDTCLLDGITVAGGDATDAPDNEFCGGGAAQGAGGSPTFRHCRFLGCRSDNRHGGAISFWATKCGQPARFSDCLFQGNRSGNGNHRQGGAIMNTSGWIHLLRCDLVRNRCSSHGGAVACIAIPAAPETSRVVSCRFLENHADSNGGAVFFRQIGALDMDQCVLAGNTASHGGAIHLLTTASGQTLGLAITHCTLAGNAATVQGDGIFASDNGNGGIQTVLLANTILWDGGYAQENNVFATADFSCLTGGWAQVGTDNIDLDPLFSRDPASGLDGQWTDPDDDPADPDDAWDAFGDNDLGDLRLPLTSPCVDTGSNALVADDFLDMNGNGFADDAPLDLAGNPRVLGAATDRGAFEYALMVDTITSATADGTYGAGDPIDVTLTFTEAVTLTGGNLTVTLDTGGTAVIPPFGPAFAGSAVYTVAEGHASDDLAAIAVDLDAGATLTNGDGDSVDLFMPAVNIDTGSDIVIDTSVPPPPEPEPEPEPEPTRPNPGYTGGFALGPAPTPFSAEQMERLGMASRDDKDESAGTWPEESGNSVSKNTEPEAPSDTYADGHAEPGGHAGGGGPTAEPEHPSPQARVRVNKDRLQSAELHTAFASLQECEETAVDIYIAVVVPNREVPECPLLYSLVCENGGLRFIGPDFVSPVVRNYRGCDLSDVLFFRTDLTGLPTGDYAWHVVLVRTGQNIANSSAWLSHDTAAFQYVSNGGNANSTPESASEPTVLPGPSTSPDPESVTSAGAGVWSPGAGLSTAQE